MSKSSTNIFCGCSFTEDRYPFKVWPTIIGDMSTINMAKSGAGNLMISSQVIKAVTNNKDIKHVYIMWSDWDRDSIVNNTWQDTITDQKDLIDMNLNIILSTQLFLKSLNIPYTMASISEPIIFDDSKSKVKYDELTYFKYLIEHPIFDMIDKDNYWGWPISNKIGGKNIKSWMNKEHRISKEDGHPNELGHQAIASELYDYSRRM
tara:strand:- start:180 stop:797 length:618 start_codon:yes stop_codon:yes gene_type:complete